MFMSMWGTLFQPSELTHWKRDYHWSRWPHWSLIGARICVYKIIPLVTVTVTVTIRGLGHCAVNSTDTRASGTHHKLDIRVVRQTMPFNGGRENKLLPESKQRLLHTFGAYSWFRVRFRQTQRNIFLRNFCEILRNFLRQAKTVAKWYACMHACMNVCTCLVKTVVEWYTCIYVWM